MSRLSTVLVISLVAAAGCSADDSPQCGHGTTERGGACVPDGSVICGAGAVFDAGSGICVATDVECGPDLVRGADGACVDPASLWAPDVVESDAEDGVAAGALAIGGDAKKLGGCVVPVDLDGNGTLDADLDRFTFTTAAPALLEITVESTGGLTGAFELRSRDPELEVNGWLRAGAALASQHVTRQVFLPAGADYVVDVTDGRFFLGLAAGGDSACYQATVRLLPLPAPESIGEGIHADTLARPHFYRLDRAGEGDLTLARLRTERTAMVDRVAVVDGVYQAAQYGQNGYIYDDYFGEEQQFQLGSRAGDDLVLVVEPTLDLALAPTRFELDLAFRTARPLPANGETVFENRPAYNGVTDDERDGDYLYIDAQAGEVLEFAISADHSIGAKMVDSYLGYLDWICFDGETSCPSDRRSYLFTETGRYYLQVYDARILTRDAPATHTVGTVTRLTTPRPLASISEVSLAEGRGWFLVDPAQLPWVELRGFGRGTGKLHVDFYEKAYSGLIDDGIASFDSAVINANGGKFARVFAGDPRQILVGVSGSSGTGGTFDLDVTARAFTPLEVPAGGTETLQLSIGRNKRGFVLLHGGREDLQTIAATAASGDELEIAVLDRTERVVTSSPAVSHVTGTRATSYLALAVVNRGPRAAVTVTSTGHAPAVWSRTPLLPFHDGVYAETDHVTVERPCTVAWVSVDVDVRGVADQDVFFPNLYLHAPDGRVLTLKDGFADVYVPEDPVQLHGNYPLDSASVDDLGTLVGMEAQGEWGLELEDGWSISSRAPFEFHSWNLRLHCAE